jgi:formylglycine-generating enzyme required for sulfatase activity
MNALRQFTNTAGLVGCLLLFSFSSGVAQTAPNIGLRFSSGHLVLNLNGDVGAFYSIQYANGLSGTNQWIDRTLLQAQANDNTWTDPFVVTNGQQFWRAVSVPSPTDANLAFIPPGTFVMGSPTNETSRAPNETQHRVTLSRGFWIGKFELTQAEYLKVMGGNPSWFNGIRNGTNYGTDLTRPVESMRWDDATNYCGLRTSRERAAGTIPGGYAYRLPTESEWEYACRAETTSAFYLGNTLLSGEANFNGQYEYTISSGETLNSNGVYLATTSPVGSYAANAWGLYDTIGNVWEWCQDWIGPYPPGEVIDPVGTFPASEPVMRGGSWGSSALVSRSAQRGANPPPSRSKLIGFRIVLVQSH